MIISLSEELGKMGFDYNYKSFVFYNYDYNVEILQGSKSFFLHYIDNKFICEVNYKIVNMSDCYVDTNQYKIFLNKMKMLERKTKLSKIASS